jgi:hypothetical protein
MAIIQVNSTKSIDSDPRAKLMVLSFKLMRRVVGILGLSIGLLLPLLAAVLSGCFVLQQSISHYYYTIAGDVFVGLLCAVAFFLVLYPGEGRSEDIWTNLAGVCALFVALLPTGYKQLQDACTEQSFEYADWVAYLHLGFAAAFFIILGGVAYWLFPRITAPMPPEVRAVRTHFYKSSGILMWLCIAALTPMIWNEAYAAFLNRYKLVFWVEVVALVTFGTCWLTKGMEEDERETV